ncbi:MAG: VTT domain-containing protein [Robiginitomaculum sp.]|nr:VTT domain-containing protein [Robiginitomaculum sp.]
MEPDTTDMPAPDPQAKKSKLKRFLPLAIIAAALTAFFALGGPKYISLDALRDNQEFLKIFVADNTILAVVGFVAIYAILVAISVPGAGFLSIFAGFLFGLTTGVPAVIIGATTGATIIFLVARSALGSGLAAKAGPFMAKFEKGLKENELSYLFILRLVPIFPFFIVNIVPALFDVKVRNYVLTTFFGIIPGSFVYVSVGNGIGDALSAGQDVPLSGLMFRPAVILPILGLMLLSMIPVVYKKLSNKKASKKT